MPILGPWTRPMMPMPMWMPMRGETWDGAALSFVAMWLGMMVPMMLPAVAPALWRHRAAAAASGVRHPGAITAIASAGYLAIWAVVGLATFAAGACLARLGMDHRALARAAPIVIGVTVTLAGAVQLTPWKARRLAACGSSACGGADRASGVSNAWRNGVQLGLRCVACCGNLMLIPLVLGTMDLGAMVVVAAAITAERLSSRGARTARLTGVAIVVAGVVLIIRVRGL